MLETQHPITRFVAIERVCEMTSISRTTVWRKVKDGSFPRPLLIGDGIKKAFVLSEVEAWMQSRIAARDHQAA